MASTESSGVPRLFAWDALLGADRGAAGVTDDEGRARGRLAEALADAPAGTRGTVRRAHLTAYPNGYHYGTLIAAAEVTGDGVTWS